MMATAVNRPDSTSRSTNRSITTRTKRAFAVGENTAIRARNMAANAPAIQMIARDLCIPASELLYDGLTANCLVIASILIFSASALRFLLYI